LNADATRTFRAFAGLNFEGPKHERDALQRGVLPKLRKLCEQNNACIQAIDLRWGVRSGGQFLRPGLIS